jgi:hypothetical protein
VEEEESSPSSIPERSFVGSKSTNKLVACTTKHFGSGCIIEQRLDQLIFADK